MFVVPSSPLNSQHGSKWWQVQYMHSKSKGCARSGIDVYIYTAISAQVSFSGRRDPRATDRRRHRFSTKRFFFVCWQFSLVDTCIVFLVCAGGVSVWVLFVGGWWCEVRRVCLFVGRDIGVGGWHSLVVDCGGTVCCAVLFGFGFVLFVFFLVLWWAERGR